MNALADRKVGELINKHFIASFQRVGSFKIAGKKKQGGNVATYFCAADGRVLGAIAGPVDAKTMRDEVEWTIQKTRQAIKDSKGNADKFKALLRQAHAQRLRDKYGARVTPILKDQAGQSLETALAYRDKDGRKLAPVLSLPPIENKSEVRALSNLAKTHQLLAAHAGAKIEQLYGAVFEGILNEKVTTKPVQVKTPFPWQREVKTR
ncbi:MAG: hypothetical protein ACRELF_15905 [Gemmataceae bacterium]